MTVQVSLNNDNSPFILAGRALTEGAETIAQDAGRAVPLAFGTLMAKVAVSRKWVPFTNEAALDGTAIPQGVYVGPEIAAADLVAGDVVDAPILVGGSVIIDKDQLVIENSKTLNTVITIGGTGNTDLRTVKDRLKGMGIFVQDVNSISGFEN